MRARIRATALGLSLLGVLAFPVHAPAAPVTPHAWVSGADYSAGDVFVGVRHQSGTSRVQLVAAGTVVVAVERPSFAEKTRLPAYHLTAPVDVVVQGTDAEGSVLWSVPLRLDPAAHRPKAPTLRDGSGTIVGSRWDILGSASVPVTGVQAYQRATGDTTKGSVAPAADGSFGLAAVPVWRGPATFDVTVSNGFGRSPARRVKVFNLGGSLPGTSRYVLVDKSVLWLYDVVNGRVRHAWPVAIGTPQTPTPTGTFRVYAGQPASGDWGVLRRPLRRVQGGRTYATRYYIHGTNAPWSIGMMASHGCVRMHNADVRAFARYVPNGTLVRIR